MIRVRSCLAGAASACALGLALATPAAANSGPQQSTTVRFASPSDSGYANASVGLTYALLNCMGELHVAYHVDTGSVQAGPEYRFEGKTHQANAAPPRLSSIRLSGTVYRGPEVVGTFGDSFAGPSLGMGCFSGQSKQIGLMSRWTGQNPTPEQVRTFLSGLTVRAQSGEVLRNGAVEDGLKAAKRAEEEAQAARRKAEAEAEARRAADAEATRKAEAARAQAAAGSSGAAAAPGVSLPSLAAAPPQLTPQQLGDLAIQQDRALAEQRLAEQRRAYAEAQTAAEAARRRQDAAINSAIISAAPALGNAIDSWIDASDRRKAEGIAMRHREMMRTKQCWDENKQRIVTDEIKLGVLIRTSIDEADCGNSAIHRWERYAFVAKEPMTIRITASRAGRNTPWVSFTEHKRLVGEARPCQPIFCANSVLEVNIAAPGVYWIDTGNFWGESSDLIRGFGGMTLLVERVNKR